MNNENWVPCSVKSPEEGESIILTFSNSAGLHVGEAIYKVNNYVYVAETDTGYYEEAYSKPIAWMKKPEPYVNSSKSRG